MKALRKSSAYSRPLTKTWECTEVQGRGRRYWFPDSATACIFFTEKKARGWFPIRDSHASKTVWVPFARKTMNKDIRDQLLGKDTWGTSDE